jgi:hypothetical protein
MPNVPVAVRRWSLGEWVAVGSAGAGALIGIIWMPDTFTRLLGVLIGAGVLFVIGGGLVLLWRGTAPEQVSKPEGDDEAPKEPVERFEGALRWPWLWAAAAAVVLLAAFVYPLVATFNRTEAFDLPRGIDGLKRTNPDDYAAIEWLKDRRGSPVIAEALGDDYTEGGRISASTGLPTVLQWPGHQLQWRGTSSQQTGRPEALEMLYTGTQSSDIEAVIQEYGISYVVVGDVERNRYEDVTLDQMTGLFEKAFEQGGTAIYRVRPEVLGEVVRE